MKPSKIYREPSILIPQSKLATRMDELAQEITKECPDQEIVVICILNGNFIFFSEMIQRLKFPLVCDFLSISRYKNLENCQSSQEVQINLDLEESIQGRHVIVFKDFIHSGKTFSYILKLLKSRNPASLKTCVLISRKNYFSVSDQINYLGFQIQKEFIVGFGIEDDHGYRGLTYIGFVEHDH